MFHMLLNDDAPRVEDNLNLSCIHPFDEIARHDQVDFDTARARHDRLLAAVNEDISRQISGGGLIAAPLCPSACVHGTLADFLLMMHCDPFGPTNMRYAANSAQTAELLETHEYSSERLKRFDAELVAFYKRAQAAWQDFKDISPDASRIDVLNHRDTIRALIAQAAERIDDRDDSEMRHLWRSYVAANLKSAA